jgi:hypothetical protein
VSVRKLVPIAFLAACGSTGPPSPPAVQPSEEYQASVDEVWSAAIVTLEKLQLPASELEPESGQITSAWGAVEQPCMDRRYALEIGLVQSGDHAGRVNIFIRTLSASTQIVTIVT